MQVRHYLEYGDVLFHECSKRMTTLIESVQYQAAIIVTGCWQGTNRGKLLKEIGWESLEVRRTFHRLTLYHLAPSYLNTLNALQDPPTGTDRYNITCFPFCFTKWDSLDPLLQNNTNTKQLKSDFLCQIRP